MVNSAGVLIKEGILDATQKTFQRIVDINIRGTFFGTQAAARRMVDRGRGSIINMGGVAGSRGRAVTRRVVCRKARCG